MQIVSLIVIDLAAFYCCLFIAWIWRAEVTTILSPDLPFFLFSYMHFVSFWWIPVVFIFFIAYETLYTSNHPFWDEAWHLVKAVTLASIMVFAIVSLGKMSDRVSRLVLVGMWFSSLFLFPVFRLWGKKFLHTIGIWKERVLILGAGNAGRLVIEGLIREKRSYESSPDTGVWFGGLVRRNCEGKNLTSVTIAPHALFVLEAKKPREGHILARLQRPKIFDSEHPWPD